MGIYEWVKSKTGVWGPALLDLYFHNALWINTIVVVYGLVLALSWQNLSRMRDALIDQIMEQAGARQTAKKGRNQKRLRMTEFDLSWEKALQASKFPFVSSGTGLTIRRSTLENIQALISERDLIQHSARQLNALDIQLKSGE